MRVFQEHLSVCVYAYFPLVPDPCLSLYFARLSGHVTDLNARNNILIAKLLKFSKKTIAIKDAKNRYSSLSQIFIVPSWSKVG